MIIKIIQAAIMLFIIIDPFLSVAMFISITKNENRKMVAKQASTAVYVAGIMLLLFLLAGNFILNILSISLGTFRIGGGIILLLLGIRTVLGAGFDSPVKNASVVIIGTPMLSGPGALTTLIVVSAGMGIFVAAIACVIVLLITWLILLYAYQIQKFIGERVIEVFSRIMGLLLTAIAVQYIADGIKALV